MRANRNKHTTMERVTGSPSGETAIAGLGLGGHGSPGGAGSSGQTKAVPERSRSRAVERPAGWEVFLGLLRGLGLLSSQLNDYRLYLPVELRRRLGDLLELPWVISFWCEGCLRVVPHYLWASYVEKLRQETERLGQADFVDEAVVQPASVIQLEHGGRWHLPHSLAELGKIDGGTLCLLCPSEGGIEIWDAAVKQERLRAIVGKLDHKLVAVSRAAHFGAIGSASAAPHNGSPEPARALHGNGHVT